MALHEQADEGLPVMFVLRRGFGSALDRGLVFLVLLRQFQIEGCLLAAPKDPAGTILVGMQLPDKQNPALFLFDPRLGRPVPGPGTKGIATLSDVQADPKLLTASGLAMDDVAKLEAFQVTPLEVLSAADALPARPPGLP